ncbi:MAG: hypothetical protein UX37_C0004G0005 [Microgenomates group bacterium GW2011_GWA2_46_16]|nr:MAG: hypothetical protein UX37_C0004G0005 [Microgenomates group bacterium GW2011_GWA2_46_16]
MRRAVILVFAFWLWFNIPTFHDGLFQVFDNVQVTRVDAMYNELTSGQFPVRYVDAFGHGAGSFMFKYYSPLIYYVGALFRYGGFSGIKAVKLIYLLFSAIGTMGMFVLLRSRVKLWGVALGTIVFLTSPYLYHDFFHRGSLTEASTLMLTPWVWWAFMRIKEKFNGLNFALAGLILGGVILTHSLTGVMIVGTLLLYLVLPPVNLAKMTAYLAAMTLGFGIAAFSLIPSLAERDIIQYENNSLVQRGYLDHPVSLAQQLINQGTGQEKSAYLGITLLVGYVLLIGLYLHSIKFRKQYGRLALFVIILATGTLYLMSPISSWIWERVIYLRYFQFPFRLLTVVTSALVLGYALILDYYQPKRVITMLLVMIVVIPFLATRGYYQPLGYQYGTVYTVDDPCMTNTWANEYLSKWTTKCLLKPTKDLVSPPVDNLITTDNGRTIKFDASKAGEYIIAKYYFPEWNAEDGSGVELKTEPYGENGLTAVTTTNENTLVTVKMTPTTADKVGDVVSVISLLLCAGLIILSFFDLRLFFDGNLGRNPLAEHGKN